MQFLLTVSASNERGPRYMQKAMAAMHQARLRKPVSLIYGSSEQQIGLFVRCEAVDRDAVLEPLTANYPDSSIAAIPDESTSANDVEWSCDIELVPELFPILRHAQFEDLLNGTFADPVSGLLRAIRPDERLVSRVELTIRNASRKRCHEARWAVTLLDRQMFRDRHWLAAYFARHITRPHGWLLAWLAGVIAWFTPFPSHTTLETSTSRLHEREHDLQAAADKLGQHLFDVSTRLIVQGPIEHAAAAKDRLRLMSGALGTFTRSRLSTFVTGRVRSQRSARRTSRRFLLSAEELATLWHPPTAATKAERMHVSAFTEMEVPATLPGPEEPGVTIGRACFRDDQREIRLRAEDRRRHLLVVGKTGMGKTTLLQQMIVADLQAGHGVGLIDPHGDLAEAVTSLVPRHRTNDVLLFDAGSASSTIGFNPLACTDPTRIDQVTSGVVSAMKKLYDSWGPRLEDTLRNAVFAEVERGGNLMSVMQLLGDKEYREHVVPQIRDPVIRSFWMREFASWSDNYRTEAVAAIQNKLRPFVVHHGIRAIVTHPSPALDCRRIMDEGRVLIASLSKGRLGEDNATLLGALLVTSIQQAAMTRADIPESERRDFHLYVDEFQNFTTGSFASILSEARKYRLSLVVAHQYLSQLTDDTAAAVFGNVGSIIAFQVGNDDAGRLAEQLGKHAGQLTPENLTGLPKYTAYARLLIDGLPSNPFSMRTLPPSGDADPNRANIIREVMARRFGNAVSGHRTDGAGSRVLAF